ncbi:hypothetical protein BTA51_15280 [Hahella sp. CCB-MM4]|uniref:class II aldolase/adducin family protein n=1 Tax=Hahella sp. (strain CCB-MM4) TaxID=1926491 RepID=UPI000B9AEABE|nr:class II aldolase/adducin family protein [Hahella sp. CCB-MM4]OZG72485.1 hypothetical protein BTA51_15280 [Hahella sp. CCB-MM4]
MEAEGVIKFDLDHQWKTLPERIDISELERARALLMQRGLIGRDPKRYGGLGFGNLSQRCEGNQFIVSGSQTGGLPTLDLHHYALITDADLIANKICSQGDIKPSSESTTHALLYQLSREIGAVIHVHSPDIWNHYDKLGMLSTPRDAPYGSERLVQAVSDLWQNRDLLSHGIFVMLGHQDGVIAFHRTVQGALSRVLALHDQSLRLE